MKKRKRLPFRSNLQLFQILVPLLSSFFLCTNVYPQYVSYAQNNALTFLNNAGFFTVSSVDSNNQSIVPIWESTIRVPFNNTLKNTEYLFRQGVRYQSALNKKLRVDAAISHNIARFHSNLSTNIDSLKSLPLYGKYYASDSRNFYWLHFLGNVTYVPFRFLQLNIGNKKRVMGPGYRSLFLSNSAVPFPYVDVNVKSKKVTYNFSVSLIKDIYNGKFESGYTVMHNVEVNPTSWLDVFLFETIMWRGEDSSLHRGLDINYLNPVIFFRPVEYSIGSPDNALVGLGINIKPFPDWTIYTQFLLDEFVSKDFFKNNSFTNKYALQIGTKFNQDMWGLKWVGLLEYNRIRPYTYSHYSTLQNYGNRYRPLAHPFGANLEESIAGIQMCSPKKKMYFSVFVEYLKIGLDTGAENNGADIYKNYGENTDFKNNPILQGNLKSSISSELVAGMMLIERWKLSAEIAISEVQNPVYNINEHHFSLGLKTLLYNDNFYY